MEHFTNVLDYPPVVSSSETAPKWDSSDSCQLRLFKRVAPQGAAFFVACRPV